MRLRYQLEWLDSGQPRRELAPGRYLLGRGGGSDLKFDVPGVSREHAELIVCADRGLLVRDLGSTNGTRVDGERIAEGARSGDIDLSLGSVRLRLRERIGLDALALAADPSTPAPAAAGESATAAPTAARSLLRELRQACDALRPPAPAAWPPEALCGLLEAWCERSEASLLRLQSIASGAVLAQAGGTPDSAPGVLAEHAGWQLAGDAPAGALRALAEAGAELLRWALPPAEPPPLAHALAAPRDWPGLPSQAPAMRALLAPLERVAGVALPVLLLGETGVGKELIAHWIHRRSPRRAGPFLALNCAALPRELLEAELFGVERGAATGVEARPGLFEQAHGGSLFLDEVGDTAAETQVRLLRALEDGRLTRVGGRRPVQVDVRVIAATNRDLDGEIAAGRFRLDLYHRLAGHAAQVPPLRDRAEDIAPLALHFFRQALARAGRRSAGITAAALLALQRWHWPGNVRELRQAIERAAVLLDDGEALDRNHLPPALRAEPAPDADALRLEPALLRAERAALVAALAVAGGEHERAWTLLGIGKTSFYKKLREHGLGRGGEDS
ncbi:MAG: sigma 54-interacting transcriptional regulator [Rhodanobacteraceae bacterium]|nr:sigma 54-interacting transcriptional regulator [Rhodanobacteraceae bacterium]